MTLARLLLVDDEPHILSALRRALRSGNYDITATTSPEEALELLGSDRYTVLLSDQRMPGMTGTELLERARVISPDTVRLVLTGYSELQSTIDAINHGAVARFLTKPWKDADLRAAVEEAVSQFELGAENRRLQALTERQNRDLRRLNAELVGERARESGVAARIQSSLLKCRPPKDVPGLDIAALAVSSEQVDGDFVDFFRHSSTCLDVVVGDVMGKGVPGALLGGATRHQISRALCHLMSRLPGQPLPQPAQIVNRVHEEISPRLVQLGSFVTLFYARIDLELNTITYVDCGHTKPLHAHASGRGSQFLEGENVPLGFSEKEVYRQVTLPCARGDLFLLYSDGLTEARNEAGELFGAEALRQFVDGGGNADPWGLIAHLHQAVAAYTGSESPRDDVTALAIKIGDTDGSAPTADATFRASTDLDDLRQVRAFVTAFCQQHAEGRLPEADVHELTLAVHEIAVNIIEYGHGGAAGQMMEIKVVRNRDDLAVHLAHRGSPFDPGSGPAPRPEAGRERGYGLFIAEQYTDGISYHHRQDGTNTVVLTKKLKRRQP